MRIEKHRRCSRISAQSRHVGAGSRRSALNIFDIEGDEESDNPFRVCRKIVGIYDSARTASLLIHAWVQLGDAVAELQLKPFQRFPVFLNNTYHPAEAVWDKEALTRVSQTLVYSDRP